MPKHKLMPLHGVMYNDLASWNVTMLFCAETATSFMKTGRRDVET